MFNYLLVSSVQETINECRWVLVRKAHAAMTWITNIVTQSATASRNVTWNNSAQKHWRSLIMSSSRTEGHMFCDQMSPSYSFIFGKDQKACSGCYHWKVKSLRHWWHCCTPVSEAWATCICILITLIQKHILESLNQHMLNPMQPVFLGSL